MDSPSRDSPSKSTPTSSSSRFLASGQWSSSSYSDSYGSSSSQSTTTSRYSPSSNGGSASKYGGNDADNDDENGTYNSGNANSNGNNNSGSNSNNNNGGNNNSGNKNNGGNNNSGNNNNGGDNNNDNSDNNGSDNSNGGNNNGNGSNNNNNNNGNNNKNNGGNNNNDNNNSNNNNNNGKNNGNDNKNNNNNNNNSSPPNNKPWKPPPTPPSKSPPSNNAPRALGPPPPAGNPPPSPSNDASSTTIIIVAVAVAAGIGLLLCMSIIICCLCRRRKKEAQIDQMQYYNNPDKATTEFFKGANQRRNSYNDQMSNLPPPPGHMPHNGGWQTPPPPLGMSSDMSSNFSGPHGPVLPPPHPSVALGFNQSTFTYEELSAATGGFSQANLLGQGGFGFVHKGTLPNGKEVAVKSLKSGSGQGEREFQAEVEIISRVHHRHLVSLVGYCIAGGQRMLVYEFLPNNNLEYHLHGNGHAIMDWPTRHKIALGSAKGLAYLHEDCHPRIIHRDIKTANILLDENCEAKVADFGLAKLSSDNYTHVSTRIMGTFGYLAPEYASSGKLTEKSDVFSFGVMLLELITGKRPVDPTNPMEDSLVDWARPLLLQAIEDGNCDELADPKMERNYDAHEMQRMIACAAASIRHSAKRRPKMSQIVRALEGDSSLEDLNDGGIKPGQAGLVFSGMSGSRNASSDYDNVSYNEDLKKFRKLALESGDMSNEFGVTSEYSANPSASGSEYDSRGQSPQTRLQHQNKNLPPLP